MSPSHLSRRGGVVLPAIASIALLVVAVGAMVWLGRRPPRAGAAEQPLVVYCAAGIRPAVEPILERYKQEYGVAATCQFGPSGGLETQLTLAERGDLFLPAAIDPFLKRLRERGVVDEVLPVAKLRLVLALAPNADPQARSIEELLESDAAFGVCNPEAAAGQRLKQSLEPLGLWDRVSEGATASLPTVTELASAVRDGGRLQAGVVWSTTAAQFGLRTIDAPELATTEATVGVGVLRCSPNPAGALRLARYLAAADRGQPVFAANHYVTVAGDRWAETPELTLFSGTVNRNAIKESLVEFEAREGCRVTTVFDGCGSLVGAMKAGAEPDAYFACDVSYVEQVSERFGEPLEVSENPMVILVREGNPLGVAGVEDLAAEGLRVGLCDPDLTALGALTRRLLREAGVYDRVVENGARTVTTGDLLVAQMLAGDKLDAAIVYRANCVRALDRLTAVPIDSPLASAVQPFSIAKSAEFPRLAERLRDHLTSAASRERFLAWGFSWRADRGR